MCWSAEVSLVMVGAGGAATAVSVARGDPKAVWFAIGYFTVMEALQAAGYAVVDQCGTPANRGIALLSYLHIAFQPLVINAFAMALAPRALTPRLRRAMLALAALATASLLIRLVPLDALGRCIPGDVLCSDRFCVVSGKWHIGWEIPLNGLPGRLGLSTPFPDYLLAVFALPALYGAWRFALFHALAGPILAGFLTDNPLEMPAIWCLFSIGIILVVLTPGVRRLLFGAPPPDPRAAAGPQPSQRS
jgi:hypothetical protein